MKKETRAYIKNTIKNDFFVIDLVNLILGIAILVLAVLSVIDGTKVIMFSMVFIFGAVLMVLNFYKGLKKKSALTIPFGICALIMVAAAVGSFYLI